MRGDEDALAAVRLADRHQLVALVKAQGADAVAAQVLERFNGQALDRAVACDHGEVELFVALFAEVEHGLHALSGLDLDDVDDVRALSGLTALGDLIALLAVDLAGVGEEEDIVVRGGGEHVHDGVLLAGGDALLAHAALALRGILAHAGALDVAVLREGEDALLLLDEILNVDLVLDVLNFGLALVAVLVANFDQLVLEDALEHRFVGKKLNEVGDLLFQLVILVLELFAVETLQGLQAHFKNGLRLNVGERKARHELFLGVVVAGADDVDDLVDVVLRDEESLQQVLALARLLEVVLRAAGDDLLLIGEVFIENVAQGEDLRLLLVIDQREHIDGEAGLELRLREQAIQNDLRVRVALELDDDAHTGAVGLVADIGDALQLLFVDLIGHALDEHTLVDLIGKLRDDDAHAVLAEVLKLRAGAEHDLAASGGVGGADARAAHDDALRREVGAGDVLHEVRERSLGIVEHADAGVDDLGEVVGRDIGRHADGDAR